PAAELPGGHRRPVEVGLEVLERQRVVEDADVSLPEPGRSDAGPADLVPAPALLLAPARRERERQRDGSGTAAGHTEEPLARRGVVAELVERALGTRAVGGARHGARETYIAPGAAANPLGAF